MVDHKIVAVNVDLARYKHELELPDDKSERAQEYTNLNDALVAHGRAAGLAKVEPCVKFIEAAVKRAEKLVILVRTGPVLEALSEDLSKAGTTHVTIRGSNAIAENADATRIFDETPGPQVLIATMAALELLKEARLTSAHRVVFLELECRLDRLHSAIDQVSGPAREQPLIVTHMVGRGTDDEEIVTGLRKCYASLPLSQLEAQQIAKAQACLDKQLAAALDRNGLALKIAV